MKQLYILYTQRNENRGIITTLPLRSFFFLFLPVFIPWSALPVKGETGDVTGFEIRAVSVLPLQNLKEVFKFAPGFDLFVCLPVQKHASIDLGFQAVFPVMGIPIVYYLGSDACDANPEYQASVYLRYACRHQLVANLSCKTYFGLGFSLLQTDLLKEENERGEKVYYDLKSPDWHGGISLRYKRIGCFIEYHRVSYAVFNSRKIAYNFGGNFLNTGLTCYF
jgi:hypothetical protein